MNVNPLRLVLMLALTMGCDPSSTTGEISDDEAQLQGKVTDAEGSDTARYGGSGTAAAATEVQAVAVGDDGSLKVLATADVQASGEFTLGVEPDQGPVVVQALDAQGEVVASSAVATVGAASEITYVAPLTTETSVEAEVWISMRAEVGTEANLSDVQQRIDASLAAAIEASADQSASVEATAEVVLVAQATEIAALAEVGVSTSQSALFEAEAQASANLATALASGSAAAEAHATFDAAIQAHIESIGAEVEERSQVEASVSAAMRVTAEARVKDPGVLHQAVRVAATHEAYASAASLEAAVEASGASKTAVSAAASAGADLVADVSVAASAEAVVTAYQEYQVEVIGSQDLEGSVLGQTLELELAQRVAVQGAVDASVTAAATLDATLHTSTRAALTGADVDVSAIASATVEAHGTYRAAVDTAFDGLAVLSDTQVDAAVAITLEAAGHVHTAQ